MTDELSFTWIDFLLDVILTCANLPLELGLGKVKSTLRQDRHGRQRPAWIYGSADRSNRGRCQRLRAAGGSGLGSPLRAVAPAGFFARGWILPLCSPVDARVIVPITSQISGARCIALAIRTH